MHARILTPEMVAAASTLVKIAHAGDTSLSRACDRAQERLFSQPWAVHSGILEIASLSNPGDVRATDGNTCTCPTSKGVCYHIAGWLILSSLSAAGIAPLAPLPLPAVLDIDELPGSFLDGDFSAFEDTELTAPVMADAFIEVNESRPFPGRRPAPFKLQPSIVHANPLDALTDELFAA